jgi:DNA-binding ferritin-like protein
MSSFKKISQELTEAFENQNSVEEKPLSPIDAKKYIAYLKALREYYQYAHWVSKGDPYYGDHLLFERLYGQLAEQIDSSAEKFIGLIDESVVYAPEISAMVAKILESTKKQDPTEISGLELSVCALNMEKYFLSLSNAMYRKMREDGSITLGLDDMIMANHNSHEDAVYLLQQRIKRSKKV